MKLFQYLFKSKSKWQGIGLLFEQNKPPSFERIEPSNIRSKSYVCRFEIINFYNNKTIKNMQVQIVEITPNLCMYNPGVYYPPGREIYSFPLLPINLRYSVYNGKFNIHVPFNKESKVSKDLLPHEKISVDIFKCSISEDDIDNWIFFLTADLFGNIALVNCQRFDIKILVTSENGGGKFINFRFDPNQEESNMWTMC